MIYGRIKSRERVLIVATGPSLQNCDIQRINSSCAYIIAVNGAISLVRADAFFTCDPSDRVRALMRINRRGTDYFAAVPDDYGTAQAKAGSHRRSPEPHVTYLKRITGDGPWKHKPGLSENQTEIHTGNSAYGALGLAYLMGARRIAFLGLDCGGNYAYGLPGRPGDLSHLPEIFESAMPQLKRKRIKIVNGSPKSLITCFEKMRPSEVLTWLG